MFEPRLRPVRQLQIALLLLGLFFIAEAIAAWFSHSVSVAADASHVLSDVGALSITLVATRLARRRANTPSRTELLAASINALLLLGLAGWLGWEAIARLDTPHPELEGLPMLVIAFLGLGINGCNVLGLYRCSCGDLNLRGAFLHVVADLVGSVGTILAAIAVAWLHWDWADGAIGLLVSGAIVLLSVPLTFQSLRLLLSGVPPAPIAPSCSAVEESREVAEKLLFPSLESLIRNS
ncbi:cation diffusion facilitator family transporter [Oscillatoria sp. FACHB-1406]|uniref:cation diffusion facilitator family transporter n=1 Tax=Oscillatoria sp. FACHB-1406 TaxID=2692846 RepID=UPI00168777D2|nr:cation diffusion facilitator family transporter [Oscillatoria sp. FACHB-1406]MBD2578757.1 cation transporter [Oscillatoria sp. FACHB-1406]